MVVDGHAVQLAIWVGFVLDKYGWVLFSTDVETEELLFVEVFSLPFPPPCESALRLCVYDADA